MIKSPDEAFQLHNEIHIGGHRNDEPRPKLLIPQLRNALESNHFELYQAQRSWCTDDCLRRFLVARDFNVEAAEAMITAAMEWRMRRKPDMIRAREMEQEGRTGKIYVSGLDRWNRPICVFDNSVQNTKNVENQMKFLAWNLELMTRQMKSGIEKYVIFMHMEKFSLLSSPSFNATKETIQVLGQCFPERLGTCIVYKPPKIFWTFFKAVKSFVDSKTNSKVVFIMGDAPLNSQNDNLLRYLIGDNWKELCGVDQPIYERNCSPGFRPDEYWTKIQIVEEEAIKAQQENMNNQSNPNENSVVHHSESSKTLETCSDRIYLSEDENINKNQKLNCSSNEQNHSTSFINEVDASHHKNPELLIQSHDSFELTYNVENTTEEPPFENEQRGQAIHQFLSKNQMSQTETIVETEIHQKTLTISHVGNNNNDNNITCTEVEIHSSTVIHEEQDSLRKRFHNIIETEKSHTLDFIKTIESRDNNLSKEHIHNACETSTSVRQILMSSHSEKPLSSESTKSLGNKNLSLKNNQGFSMKIILFLICSLLTGWFVLNIFSSEVYK